jgi:hypothetical protein
MDLEGKGKWGVEEEYISLPACVCLLFWSETKTQRRFSPWNWGPGQSVGGKLWMCSYLDFPVDLLKQKREYSEVIQIWIKVQRIKPGKCPAAFLPSWIHIPLKKTHEWRVPSIKYISRKTIDNCKELRDPVAHLKHKTPIYLVIK